jgi:hypothetical protein
MKAFKPYTLAGVEPGDLINIVSLAAPTYLVANNHGIMSIASSLLDLFVIMILFTISGLC